jgi:hypothetical protein
VLPEPGADMFNFEICLLRSAGLHCGLGVEEGKPFVYIKGGLGYLSQDPAQRRAPPLPAA